MTGNFPRCLLYRICNIEISVIEDENHTKENRTKDQGDDKFKMPKAKGVEERL